jgi:hypothetical protein
MDSNARERKRRESVSARGLLTSQKNADELGYMSLMHALSLVVLYVRWLARFALEGREVRLADVQLAAAAFASLRGQRHEKAEKTLLHLL